MIGKKISELSIGDTSELVKVITEKDVAMFGEITGDMNPAHFDAEYAAKTIFKKRIAHGMLCGSLFSTIVGTVLPGRGSIYLKQDLKFVAPVYLNDTLTAKITVSEIIAEKNRAIFDTTTTNQNGVVVITGTALIMPPR